MTKTQINNVLKNVKFDPKDKLLKMYLTCNLEYLIMRAEECLAEKQIIKAMQLLLIYELRTKENEPTA